MKVSNLEKVSINRAKNILKKHGILITDDQAQKIMTFMDIFAKIVINHHTKV